jgi:hypothetical protein
MCADAPVVFCRVTFGINMLNVVEPESTVIINVTLTTVPRSGTSTLRIWSPVKLSVRWVS